MIGPYGLDTIVVGDCLDVMRQMPDGCVDAVVTDPPYPKEYEHLYGGVAKEAARVLRVGGSLVTLCGHYQLQRVLNLVGQHLKYRWIIHYDHWDGSHARMAMGVEVTWKPLLWFVNDRLRPNRPIVDSVRSLCRVKNGHPWQQNEAYAAWAIESLTDEGDVIFDPFMGSGTTAAAAKKLGRHYFGCDISKEYVTLARKRIARIDGIQLPML